MKKFLSLLLTLTMMMSLCTVAFAADGEATVTSVNEGSNTASFDVTATANVTGGAYADIAYSVKVEWTVGTFDLDIDNSALYEWDTDQMKYVKADADDNDFETKTVEANITLTNSSKAAVNYAIAYADNSTDNLTTSEAAKSGSAVSGKLDNADTCGAASAAAEDIEHDYEIDTDKLAQGSAKTASYTGTVSLTALGDTTAIKDNDTLTLGTYTVTLSAVAAEEEKTFSTIGDILNTVEGGFPTFNSGKEWTDLNDKNQTIFMYEGSLMSNGASWTMDTPVTNGENGYEVVNENDHMTITLTFVMTDNVLTSIKFDYVPKDPQHPEDHYVFTAPAAPAEPTFNTVQEILDTVPGGFPTAGWKAGSLSAFIRDSWLLFDEPHDGPALTATVTENNDNYEVSFGDHLEYTATFIMSNNVLTSIQVNDGEFTTTYTPPTP